MGAVIKKIAYKSPAHSAGVKAGLELLSVNGNPVTDVLDYKFHTYERELELRLQDKLGKIHTVKIYKSEGKDPGIEFETYLIDKPRNCGNRCIFCFIDQLPEGLRDTLYFKDDDARLSFLLGNYITLTNLGEKDIDRIIKMRVSPINISIHTANPKLREYMLGNKRAGSIRKTLDRLSDAGIEMNCQIVVCPGINDGGELEDTLSYLTEKYPYINSISVVPVGLTKYRNGLPALREVSCEDAADIIGIVDKAGIKSLLKHGSRIAYCADELYLKAGLSVPEPEYYEDFPQLLNGVGMMALFEEEFNSELLNMKAACKGADISVATGEAAEPFIKRLIDQIMYKCDNVNIRVFGVKNEFFGGGVDVAGLLTGYDLINGLSGKDVGKRLLIPSSMLRHEGDLFLDDMSVYDVSKALNVPVIPVPTDGGGFLKAIFEVKV